MKSESWTVQQVGLCLIILGAGLAGVGYVGGQTWLLHAGLFDALIGIPMLAASIVKVALQTGKEAAERYPAAFVAEVVLAIGFGCWLGR